MDNEGIDFIPVTSIIDRREGVILKDIDSIVGHIKQRQGLFLSKLALIAQKTESPSWQTIEKNGAFVKKRNHLANKESITEKKAFFSSRNTCAVATGALEEALKNAIDPSSGISVGMVSLNTNFDKENWDRPRYSSINTRLHNHHILKLADSNTGRIVYIDPSYAQVDHTYTGKMLVTEEADIENYYRDFVDGSTVPIVDSLVVGKFAYDVQSEIKKGEFVFDIGKEYQNLVSTLL